MNKTKESKEMKIKLKVVKSYLPINHTAFIGCKMEFR